MSQVSGYFSEDTITAIASPAGGAIAIIRLSGPRSSEILDRITRSHLSSESEPRKMIRAPLYLPSGQPLDDALMVRFVQPHSYTGEDLIEFHIHGNPYIAQKLLEILTANGARQALPGEFSFRAVKNGKMNLFQAQAVADLISASNENAISLALDKMSGAQTQFIQLLSEKLRRMAVLGELGIDFADQDVDELSLDRLKGQLQPILQLLSKLKDSFNRGYHLQEGVGIALVGLPNAGKSSFFNALLGEDRSIVSDIAGTTRDVIREKLTIRGKYSTLTLRLEDTAGLRKTDNPIEKIGIQRTLQACEKADLILFIVDPTLQTDLIHEQWKELHRIAPVDLAAKTIGILTKSDCSPSSDLKKTQCFLQEKLRIKTCVSTSAVQSEGMSDAIEAIIQFSEKWTQRAPGEVLLTRIDHYHAVSEATHHLQRALEVEELDLFASDIRQTLNSLGPLIGQTLPDDILGKIFSDFCIGK